MNRTGHCPPGLEALLQYPLIQAIQERRTRRVARGVSILAGELSHQSHQAVRYAKDICNYIYETYGRFPAHIDAFYAPGFWVQFHHLELEYYERFFDPFLWRNQAAHDRLWHNGDERTARA